LKKKTFDEQDKLPIAVCEPCHETCLECTGSNANECTKCKTFFDKVITSGTDTCECRDGTWKETDRD